MPKPLVNGKIIYPNMYGRLAQHDIFLSQGVREGDSPTFANLQLTGDAVVEGNLYVRGNATVLDTNVTEFEDNIVLLNRLETGSGVTLNQAGFEINRGSLESYRIVFNEPDDTFRIGVLSNTQAVATREDHPLDKGIMMWNESTKRLDSRTAIQLSISVVATDAATSSTNGALHVLGGVGIKKDVHVDGTLHLTGSAFSHKSQLYTDTTSNNLHVVSANDVYITPSTKVRIPYDKPITFGADSQRISSNSLTDDVDVYANGHVNFYLVPGKRINIPNQIPLTFATQNEKIYTDDSNNMVMAANQNIHLNPGANKTVLLPVNIPVSFYNTSQQIFANLVNDLSIVAGNNIFLTPGPTLNVRIPTDCGIRFGASGTQRIAANSSNELSISSTGDLNLSPSNTSRINIPSLVPLTFGGYDRYIKADVNGDMEISTPGKTIRVLGTNPSVSASSGALVVQGGVGIGGDVVIGGNLSVRGTTTTINTNTVTVQDNLLVLNSAPAGFADGGILVKRSVGANTLYSGIFFRESTGEFTFAHTSSDPGQDAVTITQHIPIRADYAAFNSTQDATGVGSGGSLTTLGGCSVSKSLFVGNHVSIAGGTTTGTLHVRSELFGQSLTLNSTVAASNYSTGALVSSGGVVIRETSVASSLTNGGALLVAGGVSIGKNAFVGGKMSVYGEIDCLTTSGSVLKFYDSSSNLRFSLDRDNTGESFAISRYNAAGNFIEKSFYIDNLSGTTAINNTTPSTSLSQSSLIVSGGVSVASTASAASVTSGGAMTVAGGQCVGKNLLVGGDTTFFSTTESDQLGSGAFVVHGGASMSKNTNVGGDLSVAGTVRYNGNGLIQSITNNNETSAWYYAGPLNNTSYCDLEFHDGVQQTEEPNTSGLRMLVSIQGTSSAFQHSHFGNIAFSSPQKVQTVVFVDSESVHHLFVLTPPESHTTIHVKTHSGPRFELAFEGTSTFPSGQTSGFDAWAQVYSSDSESNLDYSFGNVSVEGASFRVADNLPVIGANNAQSASTRDVGLLLERFQVPNDVGSGDVVADASNSSMVLPNQSTATLTQIVLPGTASNLDDFYNGWWVKVVDGARAGQVRKIVDYIGSLRVATLSTQWTGAGPQAGDSLSLYNTPYVSPYFDEGAKRFKLGYGSLDGHIFSHHNDVDLDVKNLFVSDTTSSSNSSTGSVYVLGGISIASTTDAISSTSGGGITVLGGAAVNKQLHVGQNICISAEGTTPQEQMHIRHSSSTVRLEHDTASHSYVDFVENSTGNRFGMVMDSTHNMFCLTRSSTGQTPDNALKVLTLTSGGNVGIHATSNVNSPLTFLPNTFISTNTNDGYLGLIATATNTDSPNGAGRIVMYGNDHPTQGGDVRISAGGTHGSISICTNLDEERISLSPDGVVQVHATTASDNASSGTLVVSGGIAVECSQNAQSNDNGGALTVAGGASIAKDIFIGGNLYISGNLDATGSVTTPTLTFSNTQGCSITSYSNNKFVQISDQALFSFAVAVTPTQASTNCQFEFALPNRTSPFAQRSELIALVTGYTDDTDVIPLFNTVCVGVKTTTRGMLKFQSASTGIHYFTVFCRYTV